MAYSLEWEKVAPSNGTLIIAILWPKSATTFHLVKFPGISLTDARKLAENARTLVSQGQDPKEERHSKQHTQEQEALSTLKVVAAEWFKIKKDSVTPDYAEDMWRSLELHIFPKHADDPI